MNRLANFLVASILAATSFGASATITPTFDSFGALSAATFGGTGISNENVAISRFAGKNWLGQNTGTITLGLTVTPRYSTSPAVTNDGRGTFIAATGIDNSDVPSSIQQLALWNVSYYVGGGVSNNLYTYKLLIDTDPTTNDDFRSLTLGMNSQDSLNLGSTYLGIVTGHVFDPTKAGEYSIILEAIKLDGSIVGKSSIVIDVKSPVPEPESYALLLAGLCLIGVTARRRRT